MKYILTLFLINSFIVFASDQPFNGSFEMDRNESPESCLLNDRGPGTFEKNDDYSITFKFDDGSFQEMKSINQGRVRFDSCFSNGLMGYTETVAKGNKITRTTTFLKPGFFCRGGRVSHKKYFNWEIKGDIFKQNDCIYTRIK